MLGILDLITITGVFDYIFVKNEIFAKLVVIMRMKGIGTMVYFTGDIHGDVFPIIEFYNRVHPTKDDILVLLGDVGVNFYGNKTDKRGKKKLNDLGITFLCIHGNHEMRPATIPSYMAKEWHGGIVWYEPEYPNLLFAKDGEIFELNGLRYLVIGGAYSVDKYYRLLHGYGWWADEQPSEEIKAYVEQQIASKPFDAILSHTCPYKYIPREMFLPMIDQSMVDNSTEHWLDKIEDQTKYKAWFCGHWHTDKRIDRMHFLFHSFETDDALHDILERSE